MRESKVAKLKLGRLLDDKPVRITMSCPHTSTAIYWPTPKHSVAKRLTPH